MDWRRCFQRGVLRNEHVGASGKIAEGRLNSLDGLSSDFTRGRSEWDETRDEGFAIGDFCGGTRLMATTGMEQNAKAGGNRQPPFARRIAPGGPRSKQRRQSRRTLPLVKFALGVWLGSRQQIARLNPGDRQPKLLNVTRFRRHRSQDRQAIALRMRRALEHVRAKAEYQAPHLSRSDKRQRRVRIGSDCACPGAEMTCLPSLAAESSLPSPGLCVSDVRAVPRVAARRDRRRLRSSPPQLSRAALNEARTVKGIASSPDSCRPVERRQCACEQAIRCGEAARAVVHACDCAPAIAGSARTPHAAALKRLEAIDDRAQIHLLLAARGIPAEMRWRAAQIEEDANQSRKRTWAIQRPGRAAIRESSALAAHQPPIRSTHREFPETPCANSTQGSGATAQRIQATSANKLPSNRAAAGWRP